MIETEAQSLRQINPETERPSAKRVSESRTELSELMMPEHQNPYGNIHGGHIMKLVDEAGGLCAIHHAERPCVTVLMDSMSFEKPIEVGDHLHVNAEITYTGRSSMETKVRVERENPFTRQREQTHTAYVVYVALGSDGKPTEVPKVIPETADERRNFALGQKRDTERKARRARGDFN